MPNVYVQTNNCKADIIEGKYPPQDILVTITCENNYEFIETPNLNRTRFYAGRVTKADFPFNKVNDTTYQYLMTILDDDSYSYTITAEAVMKTSILDKYGTLTVYRPTIDELREISKVRWRQWDVSGSTIGERTNPYIDTAQYVVHLLKLYVDITPVTRDTLYFGPYDMGIECDIVGTDIVTLDLGTVNIKGVYGNAIDYENSEIQAYLPFIGFVSLSPDDFMDKTVSLHYQINVINGDALAVFTCDGNVVQSLSCNVSFEVPYQLTGSELVSKSIQPNTNYLLDEPAFIYVKTHKAVNPNTDLPYHDTKFYSKFGDLTGYTEAKEVDFTVLSDHITKTEIDEIITLLENGVFL